MNHDRLALFLASCTTPGFRRSLSATPHDTLTRCGFDPGESGQIAASLVRFQKSASGAHPDKVRVAFAFRQIDQSWGGGGKAFKDDWYGS
jgi:hypothetical protein